MWQGIQAIAWTTSTGHHHLPVTELNNFYPQFEVQNDMVARKITPPSNDQVRYLTMADVRKTLCRVNPQKAAGPDSVPGRVLRGCADQLADVLTDINISLNNAIVPTCFKPTPTVLVLNKSSGSCLNDYCPVALTP